MENVCNTRQLKYFKIQWLKLKFHMNQIEGFQGFYE